MLAVFCYDAVRLERDGFAGLTFEEFSNVDSMVRSRVAACLDSYLLAHLGGREFLAPLRHCCGADLPWIVGQQPASAIQPGRLFASDRHSLGRRRCYEIPYRAALDRRHRIPFRLKLSTVGAAAFSVSRCYAFSASVGAVPRWIRSSRLRCAMCYSDSGGRVRSTGGDAQNEYQLRLR